MANGSADRPFQGKTGTQQTFVVTEGYPYVLLTGEGHGFEPEDEFVLSSDDGSYTRSVRFGDAEQKPGFCILWFPMPPASPRYTMVMKGSRTLPNGTKTDIEYPILKDAVLTLRNQQQPAKDTKNTLR